MGRVSPKRDESALEPFGRRGPLLPGEALLAWLRRPGHLERSRPPAALEEGGSIRQLGGCLMRVVLIAIVLSMVGAGALYLLVAR